MLGSFDCIRLPAEQGSLATTVIAFRRRAMTVSIIVAKIRIVRFYSSGFEEPSIKHDWP